jgi:hypothetical protein
MINVHDYVSCMYDNIWWIGLVQEIDIDEGDMHVKFMHPHGPSSSFIWSRFDDTCWLPNNHMYTVSD